MNEQRQSLTEMLGIKYPILQGGMAWVSEHNLAAAVSNAGCLGIIAGGNLSPEDLLHEIREIRKLTSKPFGVNAMLLSPYAQEQIEIICRERVPVVTTGAGSPSSFIEKLKTAGTKVIPVVASSGLARRLERQGVDAVIAEGMEAGGHIGKVSTMVLVPAVVSATRIPVIAAGGIADGRGLAASLALGASGVQMGTRFICTTECRAHSRYKERILLSNELDTVVTGNSNGHPVRGFRNRLTRRIKELEKQGSGFEEIEKIAVGALKRAVENGDISDGSMMAGQSCGLIGEILDVSQLVQSIIDEAEETIRFLGGIEKW
ncbi:Enoyl-(Acyl-carrier-protein) reductase II [Mesotoga infera]|nr:Enoyl-(Acyl-carrier-protein) reductase II [Mesotoga infera]